MKWMIAAVILGLAGALGQAQHVHDTARAAPQTRTIGGRVVADDTGEPVPNARVTIESQEDGARVVLTDRDGRFTLTAAAVLRLVVAKPGYARVEQPPAAAGGRTTVRLQRAAVISGRVLDTLGDPRAD